MPPAGKEAAVHLRPQLLLQRAQHRGHVHVPAGPEEVKYGVLPACLSRKGLAVARHLVRVVQGKGVGNGLLRGGHLWAGQDSMADQSQGAGR